MELMDTSLDKFYKQVIEKGLSIPEDILGKIAVSVGSLCRRRRASCQLMAVTSLTLVCCLTDSESSGASAQQPAGHTQR